MLCKQPLAASIGKKKRPPDMKKHRSGFRLFLSAVSSIILLQGYCQAERAEKNENLSDSLPMNAVLIEDFLGTWCNNCPRIADSISRLLEDYPDICVIGYHTNEIRADVSFLYHTDTWQRSCYYDTIRSVPTVFVNGRELDGFSDFRPMVEEGLERKTPYDLQVEARHFPLREACRDSFEIDVKIRKIATDTLRKLRLHLAFTQDHLPFGWYDQPEVNHANTFMFPDGNGTEVSLDAQGEAVFHFAFSKSYQESRLLMNNAHLVVFLQDERTVRHDTLYNGGLKPVKDNSILQVRAVDFSQGAFTYGLETLSEPDFHAWQRETPNGQQIQFHNNTFGNNLSLRWIFEGGQPESSQEAHPVVLYPETGLYDVSLQAESAEGTLSRTRPDWIRVLDVRPRFQADPNPAKPGQTIRLELLSEADSCEWRFFGGSPFLSYGKTTEVEFPLEGMYNVQVATFYRSPQTGILYSYDSTATGFIEIREDASIAPGSLQSETETSLRVMPLPGLDAGYQVLSESPLEYVEVYSMDGSRVLESRNRTFSLSGQSRGIYIVVAKMQGCKPVARKIAR